MAENIYTEKNFTTEVLESEKPVLVDFWAAWCGPCRMLAPAVAEIAAEYEGAISVGKVNIDENPLLAMQYQITAIPALIMFRNGEPAGKIIGYTPKEDIENMIKEVCANG